MRVSTVFAAACAAGIPVWWAALHWSPAARELFVPPAAWLEFRALLLPDLALALTCAALAARFYQNLAAGQLTALVTGAWAYATIYSIAWAWSTAGAPILGPAIMIVALAGFALVLSNAIDDHPPIPPRAPR